MLAVFVKAYARLERDEGQTMAEYAVVLAGIALGIFGIRPRPVERGPMRWRPRESHGRRSGADTKTPTRRRWLRDWRGWRRDHANRNAVRDGCEQHAHALEA